MRSLCCAEFAGGAIGGDADPVGHRKCSDGSAGVIRNCSLIDPIDRALIGLDMIDRVLIDRIVDDQPFDQAICCSFLSLIKIV